MKWLTRAEVEAAAAAGDRPALECAIEHARQLMTASAKDLHTAIITGLVDTTQDYCALCGGYYTPRRGCKRCPLDTDDDQCGQIFDSAEDALDVWWENDTPAEFRAWRTAARAVHAALVALRGKVPEQEEK